MSWDCQWNDSPEEQKANQAMEEALNIDINWVCPGPTEATEKFGLMMASGDYPDIIVGLDSYYTGGSTQACEDGVIVDLTDLIPKYMPNYEALRSSNETLMRDTKSDDGRSVSAYTINTKDGTVAGEQPWDGLVIRKDWLDKLGLDVPTTIDEWHTALTGFKTEFNCEAPLLLGSDDALDYDQDFLTAYGVTKDFYLEDGVVKYGPMQEGYKQWVELFRQWYAEGLIDQNFVSNSALIYPPNEYIGTGRCGAAADFYSWTCDYYVTMGVADDPDFWLVAAPTPVLNEGDTPQLGVAMGNLTGGSLSVTTNAKDVELACRFLDYMYTTEAMEYTSYGIENDSYVKLDDGTYEFADGLKSLVESGEYPTMAEALKGEYCLHNAGFGMYNWYALSVIRKGEPVLDAYDVWDASSTDMVLPTRRTLTSDELTEYNNLYVSLQTLVRENTIKFILGTQSMDAWDQFQQDLVSYGAETCIAYQQAAVDRYNNR
jgi:putative aldouronate transport system substrate-binding protein